MTGPEDFLRGLDDPAGVPAQPPAIDGIVGRGRQLRARRYALAAGSAAVLCTTVAVAAFGVVPGINAAPTDNHQITPATKPPASASATATPHKHGGKQVLSVAPQVHHVLPTHSPSPVPRTEPAADPCASPSPQPVDPSATTQPSPAPTESSTATCTSPSPTPSASASDTPTPVVSPSASATPATDVSPDVPQA